MTGRWRVVRQSPSTSTDVCHHRSLRIAHWHASWYQRTAPTGVWFDVRPAVTP